MKGRGRKEKGREKGRSGERENGVRSKVGYRHLRIGGRILIWGHVRRHEKAGGKDFRSWKGVEKVLRNASLRTGEGGMCGDT